VGGQKPECSYLGGKIQLLKKQQMGDTEERNSYKKEKCFWRLNSEGREKVERVSFTGESLRWGPKLKTGITGGDSKQKINQKA